MSKFKKKDADNNLSLVLKPKKKLNKRQRQIRQKLKTKGKVISKIFAKDSPKSVTENIKSHSENKVFELPSLTAKDENKTQTVTELSKKLKTVDYRNPQNYSVNWKNLQNLISDSSKEDNQQNVKRNKSNLPNKKRKKDHPTSLNVSKDGDDTANKNNEVWFDNVDPALLEELQHDSHIPDYPQSSLTEDSENNEKSLKKENSFTGKTKIIALDCEMVGGGSNGEDDILARISIVNHFGNVLYDKHVKPREPVTDYRTKYSGIRPKDLVNAESFDVVQKEVNEITSGSILVGHALSNDFAVLFLSHPKSMTRDTSKYKPFTKLCGRTPSLKKLSEKVLGVTIQSGEHDSIQDAQAAMRLYTLHRKEWEKSIRLKKIKKIEIFKGAKESKDVVSDK